MCFARHFPYLVESIVLLAPAGILRYVPLAYEKYCYQYHYLTPSFYMRRVLASLFEINLLPAPLKSDTQISQPQSLSSSNTQRPINSDSIDVVGIVQWQFDHHKGFPYAFADTIRTGMARHQHTDWQKVCNILIGDKTKTSHSDQSAGFFDSKMLLVFGEDDKIVVANEVMEDLTRIIGGKEHLLSRIVPGNHGFPVPNGEAVTNHISEFWGLTS